MKKGILFICMSLLLFSGCSNSDSEIVSNPQDEQPPHAEAMKDERVALLSVGDNLIHGAIYACPEFKMSDGSLNFEAMYAPVKSMIESYDIANINQETILGGTSMGLSHYPSFNSPQEIGDALVSMGFDWISQSSNHSLDRGEEAITSAMDYWDQYPEIITTGINRTQDERNKVRIIERNGLRIGLLNYTYGTNGIPIPEGKEYLVNMIDKEQIAKDIAALKPQCDVMLASMHWGVEYATTENEEQKDLAQFLSDQGIAVIFGAHPHVIEPIEYITGKNGNKTLVAYSLGNFVSAQDKDITMLGGMVTCDIVKNGATGEVYVDDAKFYPTVTFIGKGYQSFSVSLLKDFTDGMAVQHDLSTQISRQYFVDEVQQIIGKPENIEVIYE